MITYTQIFAAVIPVVIIVAGGFGVRKLHWLTEEADKTIMNLVTRLLFPCLILKVIPGNPALSDTANLALAPAVGAVSIIVGFGFGLGIGALLGIPAGPVRRTFALTAGIYNYGFIPIPLIEALFPETGTTGVLFVHNLGVDLMIWTAGILLVSGKIDRDSWKHAFNGPVLAILLGLFLNFTGLHAAIPEFVQQVFAALGGCAIPLALLLAGATLADYVQGRDWWRNWRVPTGAVLVTLVMVPVVLLCAARWLPASLELKRVMVVEAAMPSGMFPIVLARHFGGHAGTAVQVVLATTIVGIFVIPFWIAFGLAFVGAG